MIFESNFETVMISILFCTWVMILIILLNSFLISNNVNFGYANTMDYNTSNVPIKHIIVIIQGRHTFDNYFGTFPNADGFPNGIRVPINPFETNSSSVEPFHLEGERAYRPRDDPSAYLMAYNNGSMNGFVYTNRNDPSEGRNAMGYYDERDIPFYWEFASKYALADRFFGPSMGSDLANNLYGIGASPPPLLRNVPQEGLQINRTIFDVLENKKIPWKIYIENLDDIRNLTRQENQRYLNVIPILAIPRFTTNQSISLHLEDLKDYFNDLRHNNLPALSYMYFTETSDSFSTKVIPAQELVGTIVYSLMKSNSWNNSAVFITHFESGTWFDHVRPPINSKTQKVHGFRVPAVIISPYAKEGYIDHSTHDINSVVSFIQYSFGIVPNSEANDSTNNFVQVFDFSKSPREPLYLEEISRDIVLNRATNVKGINMIYALSLIVPVVVTIYWYYKNTRR